ncbi:efflux RND transporter periplasmic adaptor subunit [Shewanella sp. TC10]|uniref:efflux RND transporter periplasmic adaptor subunit n=1 Tax=Shewanella sp. TC10 TaxID=1419739 RepID=UPI001E57F33F|nr:efflux RND transporter periplasmic adaptor subunit [Shewanella sp. TC10]
MNKKYLVPVAIIAAVVIAIALITSNPPTSKRGGKKPSANVTVEALQIQLQDYQIEVSSFGVVKPRTQSSLVTQASGQILSINSKFREGGFFKKGDVLVQLDDRDYLAEVKITQAGLLQAQQGLQEEQARVEQALIDWKRLGNGREPTDLVLRKPQLAAAQASMLSNQAQLDKALLALERTKIVAPFDGRILEKNVDVGRVVSTNAELATIYATDYVEIRLPINNKDLALVDLPEQGKRAVAPVQFESDLIGSQNWQGQLDRTEGAIDSSSQQLYVVAQIDEPFSYQSQKQMPLKIGQYLTAKIEGKVLKGAIVIPTKSIYQGSYVYVVEDGKLLRKEVTTLWRNSQDAVISSGLQADDNLVTTSLGQVSSGTPVSIAGAAKPMRASSENRPENANKNKPPRGERMAKNKEAQQ